jgi:hypothetical protein
MLRDAISKHVEVARLMLTPSVVLQAEIGPDGQPGEPMQVAKEALFFRFFRYVEEPNFDIASDAFDTFKLLLTKHKELVKDFLEVFYGPVRLFCVPDGTLRLGVKLHTHSHQRW